MQRVLCCRDCFTSRMAQYTGTDPDTIHVLVPTKHQSHRPRYSVQPNLSQRPSAPPPALHDHPVPTTDPVPCVEAATTNGSTPTLYQAAPTDTPSITPPFDHPLISSKLIKHIQKSARPACCRRLSELLNDVTANTDYKSVWTVLLSFGTNYLLPPKRAGKRHNMKTVIKKRLEKGAEQDDVNSTSPILTKWCKLDDDGLLAAAVTSKIEDGNIKATVRILVSDNNPAADTL